MLTSANRQDFHNLCTGFEQVIHILVLITLLLVAWLDFRMADYADLPFSVARYGYIISYPKFQMVDFVGV